MGLSKTELTQAYLKEYLSYSPKTGEFIRIKRAGPAKPGDIAGHTHPIGYVQISIENKLYYAHRLAFLYMTGSWPSEAMDHINQIKSDNRWENLRACNKSQNEANTGLRKNNASGFKGVHWHAPSKKWRSQLDIRGKRLHLGMFDCKKNAGIAYNKKALELYGEFACLNEIN